MNTLNVLVHKLSKRMKQDKGSDYADLYADLVRLDQARVNVLSHLSPHNYLSAEAQDILKKILKRANLEPVYAKRVFALEKSFYTLLQKSPAGFSHINQLQRTIALDELANLDEAMTQALFQELIRIRVNHYCEQGLQCLMANA